MRHLKPILLVFSALMIGKTVLAQQAQSDFKDVVSLDAILAALYDVISGDASKPRDWDRFRLLFAPGARLMPIVRLSSGKDTLRVMTPDDYVESSKKRFAQRGFLRRKLRGALSAMVIWFMYLAPMKRESKQATKSPLFAVSIVFNCFTTVPAGILSL
ncbi:MAG: hypothetical protein CMR00_07655 [[Chlorobium] sp. 445]|nr:MAG: hypothetical protein CMR00_07655 [[Chlorobium] sp. 445]